MLLPAGQEEVMRATYSGLVAPICKTTIAPSIMALFSVTVGTLAVHS